MLAPSGRVRLASVLVAIVKVRQPQTACFALRVRFRLMGEQGGGVLELLIAVQAVLVLWRIEEVAS